MSTKSPSFKDVEISDTLTVYTNGSDEVFVTNKRSGVVIRISDAGENIVVTAAGYRMSPTSKNGNDAIRVSKR